MKQIKINLKPLVGIDRKVTIFPSVDLMLQALDLTETVETIQNDSNDISTVRNVKKSFIKMLEFIQATLKLSDSEMEKFRKNSSPEKVGDVLGRIVMMLQGVTPDQIDKVSKKQELIRKATEKDPKK
ncbi:MAG: phage tail assembly chaperone [Lactobacillus sp.]|nr:phage tail assembly chaperone [Lactobacillus sp.]